MGNNTQKVDIILTVLDDAYQIKAEFEQPHAMANGTLDWSAAGCHLSEEPEPFELRRSQLRKPLKNLSLGIANVEIEPEQSQSGGGSAQERSTAGQHAITKAEVERHQARVDHT